MSSDVATAAQIIFHGLGGFVGVRQFAEKDTPPQPARLTWLENNSALPAALAAIVEDTPKGLSAYVIPASVQDRGASEAHVLAFHCVVMDIDTGPIAAKRHGVVHFLGEPSMEVASGGLTDTGEEKRHLYWRLASPALPGDVGAVQKLIAEKGGGDPSFARVTQPLRLPGSVYGKGGVERRCRVLTSNDTTFRLADLRAAAERMPPFDGMVTPDVDGEQIEDFMQRTFRPGGVDGVTRFQAVQRVAGHFSREVANGRMTADEANAKLIDWKDRHIEGRYRDDKTTRQLDDFLKRDASQGSNAPPSMDAWAGELVDEIKGEWRYCSEFGGWFYFNGFVWRPDRSGEAVDIARRTVSRLAAPLKDKASEYWKLTTMATVSGVERLARTDRRVAVFPEEFDSDPMLLNTPGGVVDLRTGETRTAMRDDYFTLTAGAAPGGTCPLYMEFLRRIFDGDEDLIRYTQQWFGYSLTGLTREGVVNFWYGEGANGKSVNLGVLGGICGEFAKPFPANVMMASKHERHPEEIARLRGVRCAITSEVDQNARFDEAKFKLLSGGDKLTGRFMRQDTFEFTPQFNITIAGNYRPRITNVDEAMRRRLHLVPYTVTIPPEERDKALPEKLKAEYPGILAWAIEGAVDYMRAGKLFVPDRITDATADWFQDEDRLAQFIAAKCVEGPGERGTTHRLYHAYTRWSDDSGERFTMTKREFTAKLRRKGFEDCTIGKESAKGFRGLDVPGGSVIRSAD